MNKQPLSTGISTHLEQEDKQTKIKNHKELTAISLLARELEKPKKGSSVRSFFNTEPPDLDSGTTQRSKRIPCDEKPFFVSSRITYCAAARSVIPSELSSSWRQGLAVLT